MADKERGRTSHDRVLSDFGKERLKELAKQRSEPASRNQVMAYYGGWVTAISQLGFGLGFLFTLVVGGLFIVIGDVQVLDWAFQVVVYLVAALAAGKVSDRAFEASGVDL